MAYALDDGEDICISTSPITMERGTTNVLTTAATTWIPYSAWQIMCPDWKKYMPVGQCVGVHLIVAEFSVSAGRGEECPD